LISGGRDRSPLDGVIVVNKPQGLSSNGVLNRLKGLLAVRKMGFLGTLDPLATGVLAVFTGKATKLIGEFDRLDKSYRVTLELGYTTDTLDSEGVVLERKDPSGVTEAAARQAVMAFEGEMDQEAPVYSALKINGRPSYKLARQGLAVTPKVRRVALWGMEIETIRLPVITFQVSCSAGTYMRSLARDIGRALGPGATLTGLERTRCGSLFLLENSFTLDEIKEMADKNRWDFVTPPAGYLACHLPVEVNPQDEARLKLGMAISLGENCPLGINWPQGQNTPPAGTSSPAIREAHTGEKKAKAVRPDGCLVAIGVVRAVDPRTETPGMENPVSEAIPEKNNTRLIFQPEKVLV